MRGYYVLGIVLGDLYRLLHLILKKTQRENVSWTCHEAFSLCRTHLELRTQTWCILFQNPKRPTDHCASFFVVGDRRYNNLLSLSKKYLDIS